MDSIPINAVDFIVIAVVLVSGALAFFRGVVREFLSIVGWVVAAAVAYYGFNALRPYTRELIDSPLVADITTGALLFVAALVTMSVVGHAVSRRVRESHLGALDRSLGFVFGVLRGAIIICIAYLMIAWAVPPGEQPDWLRGARTLPLVEYGAGLIARVIPAAARSDWAFSASTESSQRRDYEILMSPPPANENKSKSSGYPSAERKKLDRLIQNIQ